MANQPTGLRDAELCAIVENREHNHYRSEAQRDEDARDLELMRTFLNRLDDMPPPLVSTSPSGDELMRTLLNRLDDTPSPPLTIQIPASTQDNTPANAHEEMNQILTQMDGMPPTSPQLNSSRVMEMTGSETRTGRRLTCGLGQSELKGLTSYVPCDEIEDDDTHGTFGCHVFD